MEEIPENNTVESNEPVETASASLGAMLREAREQKGLSVADIAHQLKFAPRQIEALEMDDFKSLPEMTFLRGFIRSYAKILGIDADLLLATLPQKNAPPTPLIPISVEVPFPTAHSQQWQNLIWLGAALLLSVLVVVFAVWHYTTPYSTTEMVRVDPRTSQPSKIKSTPSSSGVEGVASGIGQTETMASLSPKVQIEPASAPYEINTVMPPAVPQQHPLQTETLSAVSAVNSSSSKPRDALPATTTKPEQTHSEKPVAKPDIPQNFASLRLVFDDDSWVEIKDKDDRRLASQTNPRGSELRLNGHAPFSLVISRAGSVRVYLRGKQVDLTPYTKHSSEVARLTLE
jgi:cytoskeleton protein RodZ